MCRDGQPVLCREAVARERLCAYGLFSEISAWKLRFFVPIASAEAGGETGEAILARLIDRYPLVRVADRSAD